MITILVITAILVGIGGLGLAVTIGATRMAAHDRRRGDGR